MNCRRITLPGLALIILLTIRSTIKIANGDIRPETTLLNLLTKPFAPTVGASAECLRDSKIYFDELHKYKTWALEMYDSSAKLSPGILDGNVKQLGNYDQCLEIKTDQAFNAQACSVSVQFVTLKGPKTTSNLDMKDLLLQVFKSSKKAPNVKMNYEWMWCVPTSCNRTEIGRAVDLALGSLKVEGRLNVTVRVNFCHSTGTTTHFFDNLDWFYTGTVLTFMALVVASTCYDLHLQNRLKDSNRSKDTKHTILTAFSIYTNCKYLLKTDRNAESIKCLDGIRFLSICWIILGHTVYQKAVGILMGRNKITKMHEDWSSMLILNGTIATDVFFLLSGLLLAYTSLSKINKKGKLWFNIIILYVNRYLRLTPAYAIVVGFYATWLIKLGSGPKWEVSIASPRANCRANWWANFLYINNYVNVDKICMSQSWYLSTDMQLLWLSPIFLYPMLKFKKATYFWITVVIGFVISIILPFSITFFMKLTGIMLYYKNSKDLYDVFHQIYTRVYTRAGPYIIGLAFGFILFKTKNYRIRIDHIIVWWAWILAIVGGLSVMLYPREFYFDDHPYNKYEASFYAGFHRHIFALSICWLIFACVNGYSGSINTILSWRAWVPFSKLTYSAYLTHFIFLLYNDGIERTPGYLTSYYCIHAFLGNLCLTMVVSLFLSCCFEVPFITLSRLLLGLSQSTKEPDSLNTNQSAQNIFGSTDSEETISRSIKGVDCSETTSVESIFPISRHPYIVNIESENRLEPMNGTNDTSRQQVTS